MAQLQLAPGSWQQRMDRRTMSDWVDAHRCQCCPYAQAGGRIASRLSLASDSAGCRHGGPSIAGGLLLQQDPQAPGRSSRILTKKLIMAKMNMARPRRRPPFHPSPLRLARPAVAMTVRTPAAVRMPTDVWQGTSTTKAASRCPSSHTQHTRGGRITFELAPPARRHPPTFTHRRRSYRHIGRSPQAFRALASDIAADRWS